MASVSLKKTLQQYKSLAQSLESKIQQLYIKREEIESRAFVVIDEMPRAAAPPQPRAISPPAAATPRQTQGNVDEVLSSLSQTIVPLGADDKRVRHSRSKSPSSPPLLSSMATVDAIDVEKDSSAVVVARRDGGELDDAFVISGNSVGAPVFSSSLNQSAVTNRLKGDKRGGERIQSLVEERVMAHSSDITSLVSTATNILIESMQLRLTYVQEVINKLTAIQKENHKLPTPPELLFSRYEEWVQRNQRLIELNVQLYDLEKLKFELKEKRSKVQRLPRKQEGEVERTLTGSQFVQSSVQRIQAFFSQLQFSTSTSERTRAFLEELLDPKGDRMTLEAQKLQEYVAQCLQPPTPGADSVEAAGPDRYREFMQILCGYIVEKQREVQGEELPFDLVFSTVERQVIPKILPAILRHVAQPERDLKIQVQCEKFQDVTLSQLRVKPSLQSKELVPFINSISQLRASYFTPTPTGKMYAVVAAAKALYEQLEEMGESSIDGDSFLDLWIYVIVKAGVKDLATNLRFMEGYGNPRLSMDEAGYYLTTLEAAAAFIENLKPKDLKQPDVSEFVVCERGWFKELSAMPGSCVEVVAEREELEGYRVAVVKDSALNKTRLFRAVLLPTGDSNDIAVVSIVRLSVEHSSAAHVDYFTKKLSEPQSDIEGLKCVKTALGMAVIADIASMDPRTLITLPSGDYDVHHAQLTYVIHLIRLGCEFRDVTCEMIDLPSSAPTEKDGDYVYIRSPPEENSFLSTDVDLHRKAPNVEHSTASTSSRSLLRSIQRSWNSRANAKSKSSSNYWRSKSSSPAPSSQSDNLLEGDPSLTYQKRPKSPYLLTYDSNRFESDEVSLNTFPSGSPQVDKTEDVGSDEGTGPHSTAKSVWGQLFQWRNKKQKSFNSRASLPPIRGDQHSDLYQLEQSHNSHTLQHGSSHYGAGGYANHGGDSDSSEEMDRASGLRQTSTDVSDSFTIDMSRAMAAGGGGIVGGRPGKRPNVITVEVEVHDMDASLDSSSLDHTHHQQLQQQGRTSSLRYSHSDRNTSTHNASNKGFLSLPGETQKKSTQETRNRILSFGTMRDAIQSKQKKVESHRRRQGEAGESLMVPLLQDNLQHHLYHDQQQQGEETILFSESDDREGISLSSSILTTSFVGENASYVAVGCLSDDFIQRLEQNFKKDHLLREVTSDLKESVTEAVKQGQLYLQRLNFLSITHKLDGVFTNAMLVAVKKFQEAHNANESKYSVRLPENGYLSAATLQYLRQAFFTVYVSLQRLGYEPECVQSFSPTSTSEENVKAFYRCVKKFQEASQLPMMYQDGLLSEITVKKIRQSVRMIQRTL